jgi:hypothetical protein
LEAATEQRRSSASPSSTESISRRPSAANALRGAPRFFTRRTRQTSIPSTQSVF